MFQKRGWLLLVFVIAPGCGREGNRTNQDQPNETVQIRLQGKPSYLLSEIPGHLTIPIEVMHSLTNACSISVHGKSCSCVGVEIPDALVEPNTPAKIQVVLRGGPGKFSHEVTLDFSRPGHKPIRERVDLRYSIYEDTEIAPSRLIKEWASMGNSPIELIFTRRGRDEALANQKLVVSGLPDELVLKNIESPIVAKVDGGIVCATWKVILSRTSFNLSAKRVGVFSVGLEGETALRVQYDFILSKRVVVSPQAVFFGATMVGVKSIRKCVIGARDGAFPAIKEIRSSNSRFEGKISAASSFGNTELLEVWFSPNAVGAQDGVLTIVTDASDEPALRVAVSGLGEEPGEERK